MVTAYKYSKISLGIITYVFPKTRTPALLDVDFHPLFRLTFSFRFRFLRNKIFDGVNSGISFSSLLLRKTKGREKVSHFRLADNSIGLRSIETFS